MGDQEREGLRIETQRMRQELSDLKIEAELLQDKLKKQESRHLSNISTDLSVLESPTFDNHGDASPGSTASSPLITTPPDTKSMSTAGSVSELHDPPSPPVSEASASLPKRSARNAAAETPMPRRSRLPSTNSATPKPRTKSTVSTSSRLSAGRPSTGAPPVKTPANRSTHARNTHKLPASNSLSHIRTLTAQMQRLEARVQSARSKLPAPTYTPPRASPRSSLNGGAVPSSVTVRSRKRTGGSTASSLAGDDVTPTTHTKTSHVPRLSSSGVSRLSYGPLPNRGPDSEVSRPSSRASLSSYARPSSRADMNPPPRPVSRASLGGSRTPLNRPRSALGGSIHGHGRSASVSRPDVEEEDEGDYGRTPSRRGTYSKLEMEGAVATSSIPMPGARQPSLGGRRTSNSTVGGGRPSTSGGRKLEDLGETY